jgi:NAD-dependent DNA ligase
LTEVTAPTHCPECTTPIVLYKEERSGITTDRCENTECPGRIRDMLTFLAAEKSTRKITVPLVRV